jgi:hypothetical protein
MNDRDKIILIRDKEREYLRAACAVYDREALDNEWIALFQFRALIGLEGPAEEQIIEELTEILIRECPESAFFPGPLTLRRSIYGGN